MNLFYVQTFGYRSYDTSEFLIHHKIRHLSNKWHWPRTLQYFQPAIIACRSLQELLIYIVRFRHLSSSRLLSAISIAYQKQFSTSPPCVPGLCSVLWSWIHDRMEHGGPHSSQLLLCLDRSIYDMYHITDLNFVSEFRVQFSLSFLTEQ